MKRPAIKTLEFECEPALAGDARKMLLHVDGTSFLFWQGAGEADSFDYFGSDRKRRDERLYCALLALYLLGQLKADDLLGLRGWEDALELGTLEQGLRDIFGTLDGHPALVKRKGGPYLFHGLNVSLRNESAAMKQELREWLYPAGRGVQQLGVLAQKASAAEALPSEFVGWWAYTLLNTEGRRVVYGAFDLAVQDKLPVVTQGGMHRVTEDDFDAGRTEPTTKNRLGKWRSIIAGYVADTLIFVFEADVSPVGVGYSGPVAYGTFRLVRNGAELAGHSFDQFRNVGIVHAWRVQASGVHEAIIAAHNEGKIRDLIALPSKE